MTIGERIKILRKKNDLTQEKLADYLCVSYQAVSKWECGASSPDLSLIGPLTRLLHVTADELLGLTRENTDDRRRELEAKYQYTWETGDLSVRYDTACAAVSEYPGEMKYLDWLAWCEAMRSFSFKDDKEYIAEQEKAIRHFACVIENATDKEVKASSIQGIVQYLSFRGRQDEARKYAELYPENLAVSKDMVLLDCLSGEEKVKHQQEMLERMLTSILNHLRYLDTPSCDAREKILQALIPDENYLYYHCILADIYLQRASICTVNGEHETAVEMLKKSLEHAVKYDECMREDMELNYTSPFFDKMKSCTKEYCRTGTETQVEEFYSALEREPFTALCDREEFKTLLGERPLQENPSGKSSG